MFSARRAGGQVLICAACAGGGLLVGGLVSGARNGDTSTAIEAVSAPPLSAVVTAPIVPVVTTKPAPVTDLAPPTTSPTTAPTPTSEGLPDSISVYFATGGVDPKAIDPAAFDAAVAAVRSVPPGTRVTITGEAERSGNPEAEWELSAQRAEAVALQFRELIGETEAVYVIAVREPDDPRYNVVAPNRALIEFS
jgi:outer membrane protein OmpA-like peptidoglycan-associated protein